MMPNNSYKTSSEMSAVENGHEFSDSNFTQSIPHTEIFKGVTGLTFTGCNLLNCDVPKDAVIKDCLHFHKSLCSHLHPNLDMPACVENCVHAVDMDDLYIDGELLIKAYHYEDEVVV